MASSTAVQFPAAGRAKFVLEARRRVNGVTNWFEAKTFEAVVVRRVETGKKYFKRP